MLATTSALCSTTRLPSTWIQHSRCRIFTSDSSQSVRRIWRRLDENSGERYRFLIVKMHREYFSSAADLLARPSSSFAARNFAPVEVSHEFTFANCREDRR